MSVDVVRSCLNFLMRALNSCFELSLMVFCVESLWRSLVGVGGGDWMGLGGFSAFWRYGCDIATLEL